MIVYVDDLFAGFARSYDARRETEMSLSEYLEGCRSDPMMYASAPERILAAIGEPQLVDTAKDTRLGRIFMNRTIRVYPAFSEFYGMEETIERIVSFFRHAAQGLEERKQILYLLGPAERRDLANARLRAAWSAALEETRVLLLDFFTATDAAAIWQARVRSVCLSTR